MHHELSIVILFEQVYVLSRPRSLMKGRARQVNQREPPSQAALVHISTALGYRKFARTLP
jgi:hypothetical protein